MATTVGMSKCPMCAEETSDLTLHYRTCKGADGPLDSSNVDSSPTPTVTARVKFTWTSASGYTYQNVTLLSAFQQSIELFLRQTSPSSLYVSDEVDVPVGEFDGQLVIGSSFCYPVKKFLIEQDGDMIPLEMDISKVDQSQDAEEDTTTTTGTYTQYMTAYTPTGGESDPEVHYNPAYGYEGGGGKRFLMIFTPARVDDTAGMEDISYVAKKSSKHKPSVLSSPPPAEQSPTVSESFSDDFSKQLSEEGFTPAAVKSKKGGSSSSTAASTGGGEHTIKKSYIYNASYTTKPSETSSVHSSTATQKTTPTATTATTHSTRQQPSTNERFSVSRIKEGGSGSSSSGTNATHSVSREEYESVCSDRDRMMADHGRVKAQLEGKVKRLEKKLSKYEGTKDENDQPPSDGEEEGLAELREELDEVQSELERKEKELAEAKDRMTALENQIEEYAGTIDDQNKIIHNYTHHGGGDRQYMKLQELYSQLAEFTKKQQVEYRLKIMDSEKKINECLKFLDENSSLRETCDKISSDLIEYRAQTKQLLNDMEAKNREIVVLKEELQRVSDRGDGERLSRRSEMEALEIENLHQKCDGWRESAERASEEVEVLRIQVHQLEQERDSLNQELHGLADRLQSSLSDKEAGQSKVSDLKRQIRELQDTRVTMEEEMIVLRSEKTQLLESNAELKEACDPNQILKVRQQLEMVLEEKDLLEAELKGVQKALDTHHIKNLEMKDQLEKTTDPSVLTRIRDKMQRYKQERDAVKKELIEVKSELNKLLYSSSENIQALEQQVEELKRKKRQYRETAKQLEQINANLKKELNEKDEILSDNHGNELGDYRIDGNYQHDVIHTGEVGVANVDHSSPPLSSKWSQDSRSHMSSTQSLPIVVEPRKKSRSGIILTSSSKSSSSHRGSYTSVLEPTSTIEPDKFSAHNVTSATPQYVPSLNVDEEYIPVQIRTKTGLCEAYVQRLDRDALGIGKEVIVQRKGDAYERGVVKYFGYPIPESTDLVIGLQLELLRTDISSKANDGTYKDNVRYFKCAKGYGLFVSLSKLFIQLNVDQ